MGKKRVRTIFISDVHVCRKGSRAKFAAWFLSEYSFDYLFLVGDIYDFWHVRKKTFWTNGFSRFIETILKKTRKDTEVYYIPGNHDDKLRQFCGLSIGNIHIISSAVHELKDGRKMLVCHGDEFDCISKYARWITVLGDHGYELLININRLYNWTRALFGMKYWSLSSYLKHKVKKAVNFISDFEQTLVTEARMKNLDGVICGHIHHAEIREYNGIIYCNTGDWVESHTAVIEHMDGILELVYWKDFEGELEDEQPFVNNDIIFVNDKERKTAAAMAILD